MIEGFAAVFKKRRYHKRKFIILLTIAFQMELFASHGEWNCMYLYYKVAMEWPMTEYTYYTTVLGFLGFIGQFALVPILTGVLKLHDSTVSLFGKILNNNIFCRKTMCRFYTQPFYRVVNFVLTIF